MTNRYLNRQRASRSAFTAIFSILCLGDFDHRFKSHSAVINITLIGLHFFYVACQALDFIGQQRHFLNCAK